MAHQDLGNSNTPNCKSFCESFLKTWNAGELTSRNVTGLNKILAGSTSGFYMVKSTLWDVAFFGMISPNFLECNKRIPTNVTLECYTKMCLNFLVPNASNFVVPTRSDDSPHYKKPGKYSVAVISSKCIFKNGYVQ